MSNVRIAIPAYKSRSKIHFSKGKHWSIIEHIILEATSFHNYTVSQLEEVSNIPRSIIVESLSRLMRAGWVEVIETGDNIEFKATLVGKVAAEKTELPSVVNRASKNVNFIFEPFSGSVFKSHEAMFCNEARMSNLGNVQIVKLTGTLKEKDPEQFAEIFLADDEKFISCDSSIGRSYRGYAVFTISNGSIENRPTNLPDELYKIIVSSAAKYTSNPIEHQTAAPVIEKFPEKPKQPHSYEINLRTSDIILGAEQHERYLNKVLDQSKSIIFIHSTFIRRENFETLLPKVKKACSRGVKIYIYWGHDDSNENSTITAINEIRGILKREDINYAVHISARSTTSHCKIIISDSGSNHKIETALGSCNWLSTPFKSYECSLTIRDQSANQGSIRLLLSLISSTHDDRFVNPLLKTLESLKSLPSSNQDGNSNCKLTYVTGSSHASYVLKLRDEASSRALVTSNKLSPAATPAILKPLIAATENNANLKVDIIYGRTSAGLSRAEGRQLSAELTHSGISLRPIKHTGIHAKIIAWDSNHALISSMNWLSTTEIEQESLHEIGVYIESEGLADLLHDSLLNFETAS